LIGACAERSLPERARGSALVATLIVISIALAMIAALLAATFAETRLSSGARDDVQALYIAEAGIADALNEIASAVDRDGDGLGTIARSFGGGSYAAVATPTGTAYLIRSSGTIRQQVRTVQALFERATAVLFPRAALGTLLVWFGNGPTVDAWDSSLGTYASQAGSSYGGRTYAVAAGNVLSNGAVTANPTGSPFVFGDVAPGAGFSVPPNVYVSGSTAPAGAPVLPIEVLPPAIAGTSSLSLTGAGNSATIGPGDVAYTGLTVQNSARLTIRGPARVVISGDARVQSSATVTIDATNGPVQLFVGGGFTTDQTAALNTSTWKPADFTVFMTGTGEAEHSAAAPFYGSFYATKSSVTIRQSADVYGAIVGKSIYLRGSSRLHYDADLGRRGNVIPGRYRMKLWRELVPGASS
jgi:hypothetical protein